MSTTDVAPPPLSVRLRAETKEAHTRAERAGIMRRVLRGEVDATDYLTLLDALRLVYDALESALDAEAHNPLVAPFEFARLRRLPSLVCDVATLDPWMLRCAPMPEAARALVHRIDDAWRHAPARLVAHAYVRYLGDLSGGQILRRLVQRALALTGDEGTQFYDFAPHDPDALKRDFRVALDALPLDAADAIVDEAQRAFALHEALFVELDR